MTEFIQLFNNESFYEAHEILEELWLETTGPRKPYYQGLIQCAVAFAHWQRHNPRGALQVGNRGLAALHACAVDWEGIDLPQLIRECEEFLAGKRSNFPKIQTMKD